MLNVDFFQPYKHLPYSLGAIYLTILNLRRGIRSKQENTILVGLIPGPHEPQHDLNTYLEPLVADLLKLWNGMQLNVAGRKVCGFLGHNAHLGCSQCYKQFSGSVGNMDFSGFDRENWVDRF